MMENNGFDKEKFVTEKKDELTALAIFILFYRASLIMLVAILFAIYLWGGMFLYFWFVFQLILTLLARMFKVALTKSLHEEMEDAKE